MPSHLHLILVLCKNMSLLRAFGETHRRFNGTINARLRVTGHVIQGLIGRVAMDELYSREVFL